MTRSKPPLRYRIGLAIAQLFGIKTQNESLHEASGPHWDDESLNPIDDIVASLRELGNENHWAKHWALLFDDGAIESSDWWTEAEAERYMKVRCMDGQPCRVIPIYVEEQYIDRVDLGVEEEDG